MSNTTNTQTNARAILFQLFPLLAVFAAKEGQEGISSSEANRLKNNNTNSIGEYESLISRNEADLYTPVREHILSGRTTQEAQKTCPNPLTPQDLEEALDKICRLASENANYGEAISVFDDARTRLKTIDVHEIAKLAGIVIPAEPLAVLNAPSVKTTYIDWRGSAQFDSADSVNALVSAISADTLKDVQGLVQKAYAAESKAAVYSKCARKTTGFLSRLRNARKSLASVPVNGVAGVFDTPTLCYSKQEFAELDKKALEAHDLYQKECNSYMKQIRDHVRKVEAENNKVFQAAHMAYAAEVSRMNNERTLALSQAESVRNEMASVLAALKIYIAPASK